MRRPHRNAHRMTWLVLIVAIPAIILTALALRQDPSTLPAPERLAEPSAAAAGGSGQ